MERRCASYARFSSDLQRESSIEDQIRKCREHAVKQSWIFLDDYVRFDQAVSGEALHGRGALQGLIAEAKRKPRPFDCLMVEDTSRLARNLSDALRIVEILKFYGVEVVFVSQGIDTAQESARSMVALQGIIDEQYLTGLRDKVHRGQEGRVLQGYNPGGCCYGYHNVPIEELTRRGKYGRPAVLGVRQEVIEEEAAVVRRIFQMYAEGCGLAGIATRLNEEHVAAPRPARNRLRQAWSRYTVREMLHNERYRGVIVWNRTRKTRNPESGRKVSKARPESDRKRIDAPHLRIVPEELWNAAHQRNAEVNRLGIARLGGLSRTQPSRPYLFSGLLACGWCQSSVVTISGGGKRGYVKYGCHTHKHSGVCNNSWTIRRDRLEEQLLAAMEQRLFKPAMIDRIVKSCEQRLRERFAQMEREGMLTSVDALRRQQAELRAQAARLAVAIGMAVSSQV